jgi:RNA polymerase sigma-70 factor (ECF subfamily)
LDDFGEFYVRTYSSAYRTAVAITGSRVTAEDATQQAYCDAYRGRGSFRGEASPDSWLLRIVVNRAIDELRSRQRHGVPVSIEFEDVPGGHNGTDRLDPFLLEALAELQPRQRAAIVLRYFHGYPVHIIGRILDTSADGTSMLLSRALAKLRLKLADEPTKDFIPQANAVRQGDNHGSR